MNIKTNIMNFKDKLVSETYQDWLLHFANGEQTYPQIVELDPTTNCMFSCPECISADVLHGDTFKKETLLNIITEFKDIGVKGVVFIGGGEPLSHPHFGEVLKYTTDCGIKAGITTNGLLIDKWLDVIAECASWTRISLDASNKEAFNKARPNKVKNSFERIVHGMEKLNKTRKGLLGISYLLMETRGYENVSDMVAAAQLAKDIGCDYFEYKPLLYSNHVLFDFSDEFLKRFKEEKEKLNSLETKHFKIYHPTSMGQYDQKDRTDLNQKKPYTECPATRFRTIVTPRGVYPCPYKRGHKQFSYGKIQDSFLSVYNSPEREDVYKRLDPSKYCDHYCIRNEVNEFLLDVLQNPEKIQKMEFPKVNDVFV